MGLYGIALYSYDKQLEGELSVREGEHVLILSDTKDGWSDVRNEFGDTGFVPSHYVAKTDELDLEPTPQVSDVPSPKQELAYDKKAEEMKKSFWKTDNYGFTLLEDGGTEEEWQYHADLYVNHQREYTKKMAKQRKRWKNELNKKFDRKSMKLLCRKGVPPELRGQVWYLLSGAQKKKEQNPNLYNQLKEKHCNDVDNTTKQIAKDICRTFPDNVFFSSRETKNALSNILRSYAFYNPQVGYCQAMNFIAGILLFHMGEENAFYTLDALISDEMYLPPDLYDDTLQGLRRNTHVLDVLLRERYPQVHEKLKKLFIDPLLLTTKWFMKVYLGTFPIETSLRVWDAFFAEGFKVLYRVGLAYLSVCQDELLVVDAMDEAMDLLTANAKESYDCRSLLKKAFAIKRFGRKKIRLLRDEYDQMNGIASKTLRNQKSSKSIISVKNSPKTTPQSAPVKPSDTPVAGAVEISLNDVFSESFEDEKREYQYVPKIKRKELLGRYDTVTFLEAERFLFDRNRTMRRQKQMVEVTQTDLRLEETYLAYVAEACTRIIDGTEGESEEEDEEEKKKVTDFKKRFPRRPDLDVVPVKAIELYKSNSMVLVYDGDKDKLAESIKILEKRGKYAEAGKALHIVANHLLDNNDNTNAMLSYERACAFYEKCSMLNEILVIRSELLHAPVMFLELFETLAENYEWVKQNCSDLQYVYEAFAIMLRLGAFLKGDGSEGTYELKEKLEESQIKDSFYDLYEKLFNLLNLIENGDRDKAAHLLDEMENFVIGEDDIQAKFESIRVVCKKYVNT
jgi:uncharacterized protein YgiM (DUF1202 family)